MHPEQDMLKPGENPRQVLPRHEERGEVAFYYTLKMIAEAAGVTYQTVRKAVTTERLRPVVHGDVTAEGLRSVAAYILRTLAHKSAPLDGDEVQGMLPPHWRRWWRNRWPKFELYRCANPDCDELLLGPGACGQCGGDKRPQLKLGSDGHILVLVSRDYIPLHRLITQTPRGMHTHHRDGNPWNNRYSNLESLEPKEHEARHVGSVLSARVLPNQPPRKPLRSEVGGMSRAEYQQRIDVAYTKGIEEGLRRARAD